MRLVMGPVLIYIGFGLYSEADDRFGIAYGGFCIAYGIYYTLKPIIWIAFRWTSFKEIEFDLELTTESIKLKEENSFSETAYSAFRNILRRKSYYALEIEKQVKIYLPKDCLLPQEIQALESKSKHKRQQGN